MTSRSRGIAGSIDRGRAGGSYKILGTRTGWGPRKGGPSQSINLLVAPLHSPGNGGVPSQVAVQDLELTALYQHSESACVVTAGNPCACAADETQCGTGAPLCSDVNSDPNNCGACAESGGQVCRDGNWCIQGACQCPGAEVSCAGVCADTTADPANCGGCGLECPAATFCYQSLCYLDTAELINAASGRCLLAPGAAASATQLEISDCGQGSGENFYFYGGQLELNGACVDVAGSGTTPGTVVDLYPCTGNANQQWALEPAGEIVGVQSGMCLEAVQGATNNGALVDLNTCTGNTNQLWTWQ